MTALLPLPFLGLLAFKSILLLGLALGLCWSFRRWSAATHHHVLLAAMAGLLALPVLALSLPGIPLPLGFETATPPPGEPLSAGTLPSLELTAPAVPSPEAAAPARPWDWSVVILATWATGTGLILLGLLAGFIRLHRRERRCQPVTDPGLRELCAGLALQLGLRRRVRLLQGDGAAMPMVWGVARPRLLLPAGAERWSPQRQEAVLAHELAHLRRGDCRAQFMAMLACSLYWWNPLAWLAAREMSRLREEACDDLVLLNGASPDGYAQELLQLAAHRQAVRLAPGIAMARPGQLESRLHAILDGSRNRRPPGWARLLLLLAVTGGVTIFLASAEAAGPEAEKEKTLTAADKAAIAKMEEKLQSIVIPEINFHDASLEEALTFLARKAKEIDPEMKDLKFVFAEIKQPGAVNSPPTITVKLHLKDIPLADALRYLGTLTGTSYQVTPEAIIILHGGTPPPPKADSPSPEEQKAAREKMQSKLDTIIIPKVNFQSASIEDVLMFLNAVSKENDPEGKGVSFVYKKSTDPDAPMVTSKVTLQLQNAPLSEVLRFIQTITNLKMRVEPYAVFLGVDLPVSAFEVITYNVPASFFGEPLAQSGDGSQNDSPPGNVKNALIAKGIPLGVGEEAVFLENVSKLILKATPENHEAVQALLNAEAKVQPSETGNILRALVQPGDPFHADLPPLEP